MKWISILEELPKFGQNILMLCSQDGGKPRIIQGELIDRTESGSGIKLRWSIHNRVVTHWMDSPELPN